MKFKTVAGYEFVIEKIFSPRIISKNHPDFDNVFIHGKTVFETPEAAIAEGTRKLAEIEKNEFRWKFAGRPATVTANVIYR